jgi:hypothetical protein
MQAVAHFYRVSTVVMNVCMAVQFLEMYEFFEAPVQLLTLVILTLRS